MSEDPADRAAAIKLRELFRKNTLAEHNKCDFDLSPAERKLAASPLKK